MNKCCLACWRGKGGKGEYEWLHRRRGSWSGRGKGSDYRNTQTIRLMQALCLSREQGCMACLGPDRTGKEDEGDIHIHPAIYALHMPSTQSQALMLRTQAPSHKSNK
eukprot:1159195-Pelagomonas_calceolata.AAC.8